MWFFISHLILNLWLQCMHNYTFGFVYFHQKIWYQFIFFNNYLFLPVNCYLKHNLQIFPIFEGFLKPSLKYIFFLLTSFMVSSSIRTICLFRSSIVLVPFFPRLEVKVWIIALTLIIYFVNPFFSPSVFCSFYTIFSLNFIYFRLIFSCFFSCPVWVRRSLIFKKKKFNNNCNSLQIFFSLSAVTCSLNSFFVWIVYLFVSFGFSSRWFSFQGFYKSTLMLLSGLLLQFVPGVKC